MSKKFKVKPNHCKCHPETCGCNPWIILYPDGAKYETFWCKSEAEKTCEILNKEQEQGDGQDD
jgi:hypothetical protein